MGGQFFLCCVLVVKSCLGWSCSSSPPRQVAKLPTYYLQVASYVALVHVVHIQLALKLLTGGRWATPPAANPSLGEVSLVSHT